MATLALTDTVRFLQIEPTTRCNFTCGFCAGRSMPQADLAFDRFEKLIAAFPSLEHVELQGEGESLLHPKFIEMVSLARARGIKVSFISNGSFFTSEMIDRLLTLGIEKISVSLESADAETFRRIRGGKLDKVIRGVEELLAERKKRGLDRPVVGFSITVLRSTQDHLAEILALYRRLGLDGGVTMQPLEKKAEYARNYDDAMAKEQLDGGEADRVWVRFLADKDIVALQKSRTPVTGFFDELMDGWRPGARRCPWLDEGMYVNNEGWATPCCMVKDVDKFAYGRLGEDPPEKLIAARALVRKELATGAIPQACEGCELARFATLSKIGMLKYGAKGVWQRLFGQI